MVAPGRTGADRQAGVNGVSRLERPASFGGGRRGLIELALCCGFVALLTAALRNVGGIDVVLAFFRLVTREALFGGVGHLRILGISALPELNHL